MKTNTEKRIYASPMIKLIKLDNQISLQLESDAPLGPGETYNLKTPDYFNNDPFKANLG
ncbi:MAG: hypothetical protein WCK78_07710 [Paludibacter sp.]